MSTSEPIVDLRQRLEQLNELEDEHAQARKSGRSALNSEALPESLRANIPLGVVSHHERLRACGCRSDAEVRYGVCSECHMALPTGLLAEVQRESTLLKCENCGRFIFAAKEVVESESPEKA